MLKSCNNLRSFLIISVLIPINLQFQLFIITTRDLNSTLLIQHFASIGVEALAGVLAIIVSISFVIVQMSSQEYSKRVMEYYIRSPSFWILIIVFTITIVCNIVTLNYQFEQPIEALMLNLCIILPIICFFSLIPYFYVTMNILQPKNLINKLLKSVDIKYLKSIQDRWKNGFFPPVQDRDPALAVADIIKRSIESNDRSVITNGLSKMCECYKRLINNGTNNLYFFSIPLESWYLFSWDKVPGIDSERLLKFLTDDLAIDWARYAAIQKSEDCIRIIDDGNCAVVTVDNKKKKAALTIRNDRSYTLEVRKENGKLEIYKCLNKEVILKELEKVFQAKRFPAPKNPPLSKEEVDKWVLEIGPEPENEKISGPKDKKIYIIKNDEGTLNIYDNVLSAYFIKPFTDIARIAIINSDNDSITLILKIFDMLETVPQSKISAKRSKSRGLYRKISIHFSKISNHGTSSLEIHNSKGITYDDSRYYALEALYNIAHEAIKSELRAQTKIDIIKKFVDVVKNSKKLETGKLHALAIESIENGLELATISLLGGLGVFGASLFSVEAKFEAELNNGSISEELKKEFKNNRETLPDNVTAKKEEEKKWVITDGKKFIIRKEDGKLNIYFGETEEEEKITKITLLEVGKRAAQKNQLLAAKEAIEQLKNAEKIKDGTHIEDAIKIILEATKHKLKIQSEAIKLGEYIATKHLNKISKEPKDISVLANGEYCIFTELTTHHNEIMLLMRCCCVKTSLRSCEAKKLRSCCKKTLSNLGQGREALPICMITFNYLTTGISEIMGKEFELKSVKWNEHLGFPELTFRPVE